MVPEVVSIALERRQQQKMNSKNLQHRNQSPQHTRQQHKTISSAVAKNQQQQARTQQQSTTLTT